MYTSAEKVKKEEIKELYNKLSRKYSIDESILPVLEDFINSFIKKYLRTPTIKLKTAVRDGNVDIINAVEYLFRE
jgi:glutamyl-tRNA reductase